MLRAQQYIVRFWLHLLVISIVAVPKLYADESLIATAANFTAPAKEIAAVFNAETGHKAILSFGSSGKLYAQIANGAPFDVFLAADTKSTQKAMQQGLALAESEFTYAKGKIVLYSADPELIDIGGNILNSPDSFNKIAISNPKTAPYGQAAIETMQRLKVYKQLQRKIVKGENISQAYQFVVSSNAQLGFVALSQVIESSSSGSRWLVPENLYAPIEQNAVLLSRGKNNEAANAFLKFLKGPQARKIIESYGYGID